MTNDVEQVQATVADTVNNLGSSTSDLVETIQEWIAKFGFKALAALAIFIIGRLVAKMIKKVVEKSMQKANVDQAIIGFTTSLVNAGLMVFVILAALGQLGVQTTSFVAVLGAAGLAVGLALQGSLSNFASGVLIIMFRPFKAGDFIEAGGATGTVKVIHIFTTTITTPDNKCEIVPNSAVMGGKITNYTVEGTRRVDLSASISYGDDIDKAKVVLMDILKNNELVLDDPEPMIGVSAMASSSIDFAVRPWVNSADYWTVFFALNEEIKKRLEAEGFSIPFPQRDVHVYNEK